MESVQDAVMRGVNESETSVGQPLLFSLDGNPAPEELGAALSGLRQLPASVNLKELLLPNLESMPPDKLDGRIARICRRIELDPEVVGPAIKSVVFLFRSAASFNVPANQLAQDLTALGAASVADVVTPLYEEALPELRGELVRAAIAGHGHVLAAIDWRIDTLGSSMHGRGLSVPVAMLTFHYQDGDRGERITLQMLPEMVASLRQVCDDLLNQ